MIHLNQLSFENYQKVLQLAVNEDQRDFVESPAQIIALAYAGIQEGLPGELWVIQEDDEPVGIALIGKAQVEPQEPRELQAYGQVYRIMGFQIDHKYQGKGMGRKAFSMILDKILHYPDGKQLPVTLEVEERNMAAMHLYESFGFYDSGVRYGASCAWIRRPKQ